MRKRQLSACHKKQVGWVMTISAEWKKASCGYTGHQTLPWCGNALAMKIGLNFRAEI